MANESRANPVPRSRSSAAPATPTPTLTSVDNALHLLSLVGERRALRVAEAADELGVARSTAHRLLATLRQRGFVTQDKPNGVYRPGRVLLEVGIAAIGRIDIRRVARPALERLRDETLETSSLLLLEGNNVRFIDCVESPRSVRVGSRTGIVLPAHCTAGGKALLAALPESDVEGRYPSRVLESRTANSITDWATLEGELASVRSTGYATNFGEGENPICAVGVAIRDLIGYPIAGLAVVVPNSRLETPEQAAALVPALLAAQAAIHEALPMGS